MPGPYTLQRRTLTTALTTLLLATAAVPAVGQESVEVADGWINLIASGSYDEAAEGVAAVVAGQLNATALQTAWGQITAQAGALEGLTPNPIEGAPTGAVDFLGTFVNGEFAVRVILDGGNKVTGFAVRPKGFFDPQPDAAPDEQVIAQAKAFVMQVVDGQYDEAAAKAAEAVAAQLTGNVLESAWESIVAQAGDLVELGEGSVGTEGSVYVVRFSSTYGNAKLRTIVAMDRQFGIMGFQVVP